MNDLSHWVPQARLTEYSVAANHDPLAARDLYAWNIALSGAFFELIAHVEVTLRNAVDKILQPLEIHESARVENRLGWWFANPAFLREQDLTYDRTARKHLGDKVRTAGRDKVFASMTFGIWEALFQPSYDGLFRHHLVYAFPHRGDGFTRARVHKNVLALRNLRNRIAHHQAIFDLPLEERYEQAREILHWIDPRLADWVDDHCRVRSVLASRPAAAPPIAVIVPARNAWAFYLEHGAYLSRPGRYFRTVSHLGFYVDSSVQPQVPKVLEQLDQVRWTPEEIGRLMGTGTDRDRSIAQIIKAAREQGWTDDTYQLFLLTRPTPDGVSTGHVTLTGPLTSQRSGRGSAWVQRQRYARVSDLKSATTLADLDPQ